MVQVIGYPAESISFCPRCGSSDTEYSDHWNNGTGILNCKCGCSVYIVADEKDGGEPYECF